MPSAMKRTPQRNTVSASVAAAFWARAKLSPRMSAQACTSGDWYVCAAITAWCSRFRRATASIGSLIRSLRSQAYRLRLASSCLIFSWGSMMTLTDTSWLRAAMK